MTGFVLKPELLTKEAFQPFGHVIETHDSHSFLINEGTTTRFHRLAAVDASSEEGRPIISLFRGTQKGLPIAIKMMEKHPLGSQAFMPLSNNPWMVVVSEAVRPKASTLRLFIARGNQGVQYSKGVWHHPLLVLKKTQDFLVVDRQGPGVNLEECHFENGHGLIDKTVEDFIQHHSLKNCE